MNHSEKQPKNGEPDFRYWAFISYSQKDETWAQWLHRELETYRVPKALVRQDTEQKLPARLFPVFRDRDELAGAADLGEKLTEALRVSRNLIVVCSPNSAGSRWVNEEIRIFKALGRAQQVFALVVEGEPNACRDSQTPANECFPPALRYHVDGAGSVTTEPAEPLAADARPHKDGKRFALLKLIAGALGLRYDQLRNRDQERRTRMLVVLIAGLVVGLIIVSGLGITAWIQRERARVSARDAQARQLVVSSELYVNRNPDLAQLAAVEAGALVDNDDTTGALRSVAARFQRLERTLSGHSDWIVRAVFDGSGSRVATASVDGTASIWDAATGKRLATLIGHSGALLHVDFSPDSSHLITTGMDRTARLWDAQAGTLLTTLSGHEAPIQYAAFSPDGRLFATVDRLGWMRLWSSVTYENLYSMRAGKEGSMRVAFSPDSTKVLAASGNGSAYLWDTSSGKLIRTFSGPVGRLNDAAFNFDGSKIAIAGPGRSATLWETGTRRVIAKLGGHLAPVTRVVFSRDGSTLVTCAGETFAIDIQEKPDIMRLVSLDLNNESRDFTAQVWDGNTGKKIAVLQGHAAAVNDVAVSHNGGLVATASSDGQIRLWSVPSAQTIAILEGHSGRIGLVAFSPSGQRLVTASAEYFLDRIQRVQSSDRTARLWHVRSDTSIATLHRKDGPAEVAASQDGSRIVIYGHGAPAELWGEGLKTRIAVLDQDKADVTSAAFDGLGHKFATASADGSVRIWDAATGRLLHLIDGHQGEVKLAAFAPDGSAVAASDSAHRIRIWDANTGKAMATCEGHTDAIESIAFSPDSKRLISMSRDRTARLWHVSAGTSAAVLNEHTATVTCAAFSPNGKLVATAAKDGNVIVWDTATGLRRTVLAGHTGPVNGVTFDPGGRWLATAGSDRTVRLWDMEVGRLKSILRGHGESVLHVAFSPDGSTLATATGLDEVMRKISLLSFRRSSLDTSDSAVRLWHPGSGRLVETYHGHHTPLNSLIFLADNSSLLTTSNDGLVKLWSCVTCATAKQLADQILTRLGRPLSTEERAQLGISQLLEGTPGEGKQPFD